MFEREDWELFRTIEGLSHKAGVPRHQIASLVAKELTDNALDACGTCEIGLLDGNGFFVQDQGPGIDLGQVADLFSIRRPLRSTKLLRLPSRGALGNGLRVVAGAVLATDGELIVSTQGQTLKLIPQSDGTTVAEVLGEYVGQGTRVEVRLGKDSGPVDLSWAQWAIVFSDRGECYKGKTSPWWYTSNDFHELCLAAKNITVRDLVSMFEGCSGKVGKITAGFKGKHAADLSPDDAKILLDRMKAESSPVRPGRLGYFGDVDELQFFLPNYTKVLGTFELTSKGESIELPFVVEAWTKMSERAEIHVCVNRTPITGEVRAYHSKNDLILLGCGLKERIDVGRRPVDVWLNIITPYMPITTDGKSPDLSMLLGGIVEAITKSTKKAKRNSPTKSGQRSQKDVVLEHLMSCISKVSDNMRYRYTPRQVFYVVRPIVFDELDEVLTWGNFNDIITDHETALGRDLPGIYRDDRGSLYHPHLKESIPLGTRAVESYDRPKWTFNKILYIEKEGFFEILIDEKWPERHDCALLTSKGHATKAAKDLIDMLGDTGERILFFCIHDADAYGTVIYEKLQEASKARPKRRVEIVNLGLEPSEAREMGLQVEDLEVTKERRPVASYVDEKEAKWLQTHRVELNAMTTPQFLEWLDVKMAKYGQGKLIPPEEILAEELHENLQDELRKKITDDILRSQDLEGKVKQAYESTKTGLDETAGSLKDTVAQELGSNPVQSWREPIRKVAKEMII